MLTSMTVHSQLFASAKYVCKKNIIYNKVCFAIVSRVHDDCFHKNSQNKFKHKNQIFSRTELKYSFICEQKTILNMSLKYVFYDFLQINTHLNLLLNQVDRADLFLQKSIIKYKNYDCSGLKNEMLCLSLDYI